MKKFSIILPVRNGGEYVKECVNSILSQTLDDFNLIVLDNCSGDGTLEWIKSLKDERIIIHAAIESLTIEENWKRITTIQKNEFITLIGHDDNLKPHYLQEMNDLIAKHPSASLYQTHFNYINSSGNVVRDCKPMTEIETAAGFLQSFLQGKTDVMGTGFMMRSIDYDKLGGIPLYPNLLFADFELWLNLTRLSYKATSMSNTFSFRIHQSTTSVSPDTKFQEAFERFIFYLHSLQVDKQYDDIIKANGINFIDFYCKGLTHRLLRTPKSLRHNLSVNTFLNKCREYADLLIPGNHYNPKSRLSIWIASVIDSSKVTRQLFLLFKKIFTKPILKSL